MRIGPQDEGSASDDRRGENAAVQFIRSDGPVFVARAYDGRLALFARKVNVLAQRDHRRRKSASDPVLPNHPTRIDRDACGDALIAHQINPPPKKDRGWARTHLASQLPSDVRVGDISVAVCPNSPKLRTDKIGHDKHAATVDERDRDIGKAGILHPPNLAPGSRVEDVALVGPRAY